METLPCCNSITCHQITTKFCTGHDSTAVVTWAKLCSDHSVRTWMRVKWNFHHFWNVMEKLLVKWTPRTLKWWGSSVTSYLNSASAQHTSSQFSVGKVNLQMYKNTIMQWSLEEYSLWNLLFTIKPAINGTPNPKTWQSCSCLCPNHWNQVFLRDWRCSWSSADRRCSNYIWVINNFIFY